MRRIIYYRLGEYDYKAGEFVRQPFALFDGGILFRPLQVEIVCVLPLTNIAESDRLVCEANSWKRLPGDVVACVET